MRLQHNYGGFIGAYIGVLEAGVYAMAIKVLGAPIGLLGAAVLDVFRREAAIDAIVKAALVNKVTGALFGC